MAPGLIDLNIPWNTVGKKYKKNMQKANQIITSYVLSAYESCTSCQRLFCES